MPTQQQDRQDARREDRSEKALAARIGNHLLHALGEPGELQRVQVRPLWENHYRANVFVGADAASAKVAHSYFLVTDGDGNVLASSPAITRRY